MSAMFVFILLSPVLATAQPMGPRPASAAAAAAPVRGVPQYKYATGVRNPQQHIPAQSQVPMQQVYMSYFRPTATDIFCTPCKEEVQFGFAVNICCRLSFVPFPQPAVHVQGQEPLTASMLAAALPQEQKQMLGKFQQQLFITTHLIRLM